MFTYYFDYPHSMTPLRRVYNDPIEILDVDYSDRIIGIEACLWSEYIHTTQRLEQQLFPRLYAVAEISWSQERDYQDFKARLSKFMDKCHPDGLNYTPQEEWNPTGAVRQQETLAYLETINKAMSPEVYKETAEAANPNRYFTEKFTKSFFVLEEDMPILKQMNELKE